MPLGIVTGLGAWLVLAERLPEWGRKPLNAALITCLVVDIVIGTQYYAQQRSYYAFLNPSVVQGLSELQKVSLPQQVIAVSPGPHNWELGWWVEGTAHRSAIYAGDPIWLNYADEKGRNAIANRIYSLDNGLEQSRIQAREAGASYLFVDKEWTGYAQWTSSGQVASPTEIAYQNASVLIVNTAS